MYKALFGFKIIAKYDLKEEGDFFSSNQKHLTRRKEMEKPKEQAFVDGDFRKSSFSHGGKKVCVEVAIKSHVIGVRDSKDPKKILSSSHWKSGKLLSWE